MKIQSVKYVGKRKIYDIMVKDAHHYILENGVLSHNSGGIYSANQIFIITKAQEKEGTTLVGSRFTINIEKSRYVREKAKLPFTVHYGKGINKYSGLLDMAINLGYIKKPNMVSYLIPSLFEERKFKRKELEENSEIWEQVLSDEKFLNLIFDYYSLSGNPPTEREDEEIE